MIRIRAWHNLFAVALVAAVIAMFAVTQSVGASHALKSKAHFMTWNTKRHTVAVSITAGLTSVNHTLNFNGYTAGGMVVSVPKGYRVTVTFTNGSTFPHSIVFTGSADTSSSAAHPLAFPGATSPDPIAGTAPGAHVSFSFLAKKVGTYAIICEVGHHVDAGMWAVFKVTRAKQPSIKLTAPVEAPTATLVPTTAATALPTATTVPTVAATVVPAATSAPVATSAPTIAPTVAPAATITPAAAPTTVPVATPAPTATPYYKKM